VKLEILFVACFLVSCDKPAVETPKISQENAPAMKVAGVEHSTKSLEQLKAEHTDAFLMIGSETCVNSKGIAPHLDELAAQQPAIRFIRIETLPGSEFATPTFMILKNGEVVDRQSGAVGPGDEAASKENPLLLLNLLARNGLVSQDPYSLLLNEEPAEPPPAWLFPGLGANARRLDGWQMKGQNFLRASFAGASIRDADFSEANLQEVNFSHTDLTGTKLQGASLDGIYWNQTICPDGKVHDGGCAEFATAAE